MSGKNNDILDFLKELTQRRLLGDELENALSPFKGTVLSLGLIFQSVTKCFGPQKDELYNEGYSLNCTAEESELELAVLFIKEDGEFVNSLQQGQEFEVNVKFIGYDQLYLKPIFGKIDDEPQIFEDAKDDISNNQNSSQSLEENIVVSKYTSPDESGLTKTKQESYSYKSAEPYDYGIDDTNKKFKFLIGDWYTTAGYEVPAVIFVTDNLSNVSTATCMQRAKAKLITYQNPKLK